MTLRKFIPSLLGKKKMKSVNSIVISPNRIWLVLKTFGSSRRGVRIAAWSLIIIASVTLSWTVNVDSAQPSGRLDYAKKATKAEVIGSFSQLPLTFEQNQGQLNEGIKFLSRGAGMDIYLTSRETILSLRKGATSSKELAGVVREGQNSKETLFRNVIQKSASMTNSVVKIRLVGGSAATATGRNELPGSVNYFIGKDRTKWQTNIRTFGTVQFDDVYPGIDQIFYGARQQLEYDFVVSPKANPNAIKLEFKGVKKLYIDRGDLVLQINGSEEIRFTKPFAYQEINGKRQEVKAAYAIKSRNQVTFAIDDYDRSESLIIDPVLSFSTYLGGAGNDAGFDVAVDAQGNTYVTGPTNSAELSSLGGSNTFVAKLDASGTQRTYLAIIGGNGDDTGFSMAVDTAGNAYVTGSTDSTDFPVSKSIQSHFGGGAQDAFIAKLSANGSSIDYATYFGGTGTDSGFAIAVDSAGSAYMAGSTDSVEFSSLGNTDAFVVKLNPVGNERSYLAILGGNGDDTGFDIAVDGMRNAYLVGSTDSENFTVANALQPKFGGSQDGFLAKLNPTGSATIYSTYIGGSGSDSGFGVAVDTLGSAYVTGSTDSTEFSTLGGRDVFVAKFTATGDQRTYFTILGGSGDDAGFAIAVDASGSAHLTGSTDSSNFTTAEPLQSTAGGSQDVFVAKLNPAGSTLIYSTFVGHSSNESGFAIAADSTGTSYVTGFTNSSNFPTMNPSQSQSGGNGDAFILKVSSANLQPILQLASVALAINEAGGNSVAVIVNRLGDVNAAGSIDYATSDVAGLNECNVVNGAASSRCDYATSFGTLRFSAGETSKTIFVPLVDDGYAEGNETFTITLSNPSGATLGVATSATVTIEDNNVSNGTNPIDNTDFFIRQQYIDFLGREPDPAGLAGWRNVLNNCGTTVAPPCDRVEVSAGFFRSEEFQSRGYFIYRFFSALGKIPISEQFFPDFAKVSGFLTVEQLEANKAAYVNEVMARADFQTKYASTFSNPTAYVDALLQTVGLPNHPGRAGWINMMNSNNTTQTRGQVLRQLVESGEVFNKYFNEAFVIMQYFGYLRRTADASYLSWIQTMSQTGGDYRLMINGFMNSAEYRRRFGP